MKSLLKFEFRKLSRQKSFYICTAVMLVMSLIGLLLTKALANFDGLGMEMPTAKSSLLAAVSSSDFTMICGIFIAIYVCADYDQQTIKNVYSRGFSRDSVYFAKFIVCILAATAMFVVTLLFTFAAGAAMFENGAADATAGKYIALIFGQLICCIAYASFVFAVSLIIKKVGVSIALAILGPMLIGMVLSLIDAALKAEKFKIADYWLENILSDLSFASTDKTRLIICIVLSAVYAAAFIVAGFLVNRRQES